MSTFVAKSCASKFEGDECLMLHNYFMGLAQHSK